MLSEYEIPKRGRHYHVFGIVNDQISNHKQFKHIGAEKYIFKKNKMEKYPYITEICVDL